MTTAIPRRAQRFHRVPVMPVRVPTTERMNRIDDELIVAIHRFACPFAMSGHPGLAMPCGLQR